ncbi:segregation and condensation protein B [Candidatus Kryptobacter tengchongensis]|uniref:SMC-Scp complex subunit ScpB n=1 Tax=Kryptobacter tengchongensis TaxID=1643429 RepID=UPI00070724D0|nr:SMC-Scp complex subunit ScpB [Candidatus Kryptobacter tengchongensis]CUS82019.1 segregation and condensation protein B [Candidatus Kryptobacter tengchongensis]CUU06690.1 segregation and condensation protein B [Candidatus Kryptobacter tengchongensis]
MGNIKSIIEAIIFASDTPLSLKQIKDIVNEPNKKLSSNGETSKITEEEIKNFIDELNQEYAERGSAFRIIEIAEGYQFATLPEFAKWIGKLFKEKSKKKLSQPALETLAIIAYKQPISKPEIEAIRGVNVDHIIKTLLEKRLITIVGRAETIGRPLLYGTTKEFLKYFGLKDLSELPKPSEIEEIMKEEESEKLNLQDEVNKNEREKNEEN